MPRIAVLFILALALIGGFADFIPQRSYAAGEFGNGSDGPVTFSSSIQFDPPVDAVVNSGLLGQTSLAVSNLTGVFQPGQVIMIHQTRGTDAGVWEINYVQSYALGNLGTAEPLVNTYATSGDDAAQVLVVPQYTDVVINTGVTLSSKPWDGAKGGILTFFSNGTVTVLGTVTASYNGFAGGLPGVRDFSQHGGGQGEGTGGPSGGELPSANGNGAGGGALPSCNGGAGGGHATKGEDRGDPPWAYGGEAAGSADLSSMVFGGGGGGGANGGFNVADSGAGGNGGGNILLAATVLDLDGTITSDGENGGEVGAGPGYSGANCNGGGGGGAGGSVLLRVGGANFGTSLVAARNGIGGPTDSANANGGVNGADGRIRVEYCTSISGGVADPPASVAQISCLATDSDSDGVSDIDDNCPDTPNPTQDNYDGDALGDACDPDDDNDLVDDVDETGCGGDSLDENVIPERVDGVFAATDDDGDTLVDEALPVGAEAFDCDGDGYTGAAEAHVFSYVGQTDGDQKTCGEYDLTHPNPNPDTKPSLRWPSDFSKATGVLDSLHRINVLDLTSFLAPVKYVNTDVGTNPGDVRWDLAPGKGIFLTDINVQDLTSLIAGTTGNPSMLGGAKAMGSPGPLCPWAP